MQADGGTRTASITGAWVALALAVDKLLRDGRIESSPLTGSVAAVSCGIYGGRPLLDLDYIEDSRAEVDMNLVMTSSGDMVELQATGEGGLLKRSELDALIDLGTGGIATLRQLQLDALGDAATRLGLRP